MPLLVYRNGSETEFEELCFDPEDSDHPDVLEVVTERYRAISKAFTELPCQEVTHALLYVNQGELAVVNSSDSSVDFIGSDEATTCFIVILRNPDTGQTCLAHFPGSDYFVIEERFRAVLDAVGDHSRCLSPSEPSAELAATAALDLYVLGCSNCVGDAEELAFEFLDYLYKLDAFRLKLRLACIGEMNTVRRVDGLDYPAVYGVAMNVRNGLIFPARLTNKGPDLPLRAYYSIFAGVIHKGHDKLHNVYDTYQELMRVGPFPYASTFCCARAQEVASLSDTEILQRFSTSPHAELPSFAAHIRDMWAFLAAQPHEASFPTGQARVYRINLERSDWLRV